MTRRALASLMALPLVAGLFTVVPVQAAGCTDQTVKAGIVVAEGCFETASGGAATTSEKFRMNGFDVTPQSGTKVTIDPGTSGRSARVTTNGGKVDLSATSAKWGTIKFAGQVFDISPPKSGDVILTQSALAQPWPVISGLTPLGVSQPITLTEEGDAEFDLSFSAGGIFLDLIAGTQKQMAAGVGFTVKDGKFALTSGEFSLKDFELAHLIKINEAELKIGTDSFDVTADGGLTAISGPFGVRFGATIEKNLMKRAELGLSGLNTPLGNSGIYMQKFLVGVFPNPPYGGKGSIGLSAGPKFNFLGKEVEAVEADGTVEVRGADVANKKPPFFTFTVAGDFSLMSLPVGNASFGYWFGQGTKFSASVGIGLPSGKNDPGQPTYVGGGLSGWTSSKHFDLEGNVKLKLLGLELLGANTVLSDVGMAGCVKAAFWYVGGGVTWNPFQGYVLGGDTCDIGRFRPQAGAARAMADGSMTVPVRGREHFVRVTGSDDQAPRVALSQPGGPRIVAPSPKDSDQIAKFPGGVAMSAENGTTLFVIKDDPGGRWNLTQLPGSPQVSRVSVARPLPKPKVRAWVTGTGRKRKLHWNARDIDHQRLLFAERIPGGGEIPLLRTSRTSGVRTFKPAQGSYDVTRRLVVDVRQRRDTPRREFVADRYRVERTKPPRRVTHLRVERQLGDVVARWHRAPRAVKYRVDAKPLGSGTFYRTVVTRPRARLSVGTTDTMRVTVTPITWQDRAGHRARRTLDTTNVVRDAAQSARRLASHARRDGRVVVSRVACPPEVSCSGSLQVRKGSKRLATQRFVVPPDMTDRVRLALPRSARGRLSLVARVSTPNEGARSVRRLR